ncbi:gamma-glutamyltransferase [Gulosibacter sediminis]|uniref:gamma-glutamyltransferase n=1 Tax=Gulosibacter sediminis TaxID=1729695 RepID=UPI0024AD1168|nr:gamma-glutamyltransferase [Gulosibacter sediminis]
MRTHSSKATEVSEHTSSSDGTVVSAHDLATRAGMAMYEIGGNAVDAAVATALVCGVIEPTETTLAGSGFMLIASDSIAPTEIDFGPKAPAAARPDMFELQTYEGDLPSVLGLAPVVDNANVDGPLAAGVPRTLYALLTAQEHFGRLTAHDVLAPAIAAARDGFPVDAWFLTSALSDLERLRADPTARGVFLDEQGLPKGAVGSAGYGPTFGQYERIHQELLASTLEHVAEHGKESLTHGAIADALVQSSTELGGILAREDLESSAPYIGPARLLKYRNATLAASHAPSGALTTLESLAIYQQAVDDPRDVSDDERLRRLALSLRHAFADRYYWLGDTDFSNPPVDELLSNSYAQAIADEVATGRDIPRWEENAPWITYADFPVHDPRHIVHGQPTEAPWSPTAASTPTSGTTHVSAADADGMVVAITHTAANHFGSGIVCPRTGLLFDSSMAWFNAAQGSANSIRGGGRALANMGPVLALHDDGRKSAIGASGGRRIISAVAQLAIELIDNGATAGEAIARPRIDASAQQLALPEALEATTAVLADLNPTTVYHANDPYPMDFSRPNIARYLGNGATESAIASAHFTA